MVALIYYAIVVLLISDGMSVVAFLPTDDLNDTSYVVEYTKLEGR